MRLDKLLCNVEIKETNLPDFSIDIPAITDKSGKVIPGCAFVCIPGITHDGHDYIAEVYAAGAAVVIAERKTCAVTMERPYIITPDARRALCLMWSAWYSNPERSMLMYAVTGTNGKSSTCAVLRSILESAGMPCGIIGSISNEFRGEIFETNPMTTPDPELLFSLLGKMRDMGAQAVVMEASSHALALGRLCGIYFDCGVFTNLSPEHLDFHPGMEAYAMAKARLFRCCRIGVFNSDDTYFPLVSADADCEIKTFSIDKDADIRACDIAYTDKGIEYMLLSRREMFRIESALPGRFSVYNTLAAAAAAYYTGISSLDISRGIAELRSVKGRMQRIENDMGINIYIDYAHTPRALETVLLELKRCCSGKIITVFGCGGERDTFKRPQMGSIATSHSDFCIVTDDNPRNEDPDEIINAIIRFAQPGKYTVIRDRGEAIRHAVQLAQSGDTVLVAGKGHEDYQIYSDGLHPFSDEEVIRKIIRKLK